jgi:hypothetical protein
MNVKRAALGDVSLVLGLITSSGVRIIRKAMIKPDAMLI